MKEKKLISICIPCYNEEENMGPSYRELQRVTKPPAKYSFEFVYVDNGSSDKTRGEIRKLVAKDKRVTGVFLSRNFGAEASGEAAMDHARGDAVVIYHCDMQDPANLIPVFIKKWEEGYDSVVGIYTKTEDIFPMGLVRKLFYRFFKAMSNIDVPVNAGAFSLMDRKILDALKKFPEKFRFFRGLRAWVGFKTAYVPYERKRRERGKSSYNLLDYFKHAERSFFGFSYLPLDLIIYAGLAIVGISFLFLIGYLLSIFLLGNKASEMVILLTVIMLFGGIQLLALSMVGKYVQVIVEETKSRPMYIVEEVVGIT
ncbi:glycosyltransferase family 2 protein [Candidatus Gottesmanbacteria bacterium]|nr:glycosyltransferase family 2 protein [Candidatus Gottesmanbacteria bacterium]